jgi:uncharacterized repeat protein (TIGR03803 family)
MKPIRNVIGVTQLSLVWLVVLLGLVITPAVNAQTFNPIHTFDDPTNGFSPQGALILSDGTLYGTTVAGGSPDTYGNSAGTVFAVKTDGSSFRILLSFSPGVPGANPRCALVLSSNFLYGTTGAGGTGGYGTVFKVSTDGNEFTNLYTFTTPSGIPLSNNDGASPQAGLILAGNTLYGTAHAGGASGSGTVFAINTDGTGFKNLHSFTLLTGSFPSHNSDGAYPYAGLAISGNTLYGTTTSGGSWGNGTVFAVNTDDSSFTNLHSFSTLDGVSPWGALVISGNTLYGATTIGGSSNNGTLFRINTDGTGFTNLYNFDGGGTNVNYWYQSVRSGLFISGNTLYGTTEYYGSSSNGTVFAINTDGSGFTNLYSFSSLVGNTNGDGANPTKAVIISNNILYGTASDGGSSGNGTIFSLSLPLPAAPQLTITPLGSDVILTWPTNVTGFNLESTTNLVSPVWVTITGQNTVTNPISSTQMYFRLSQ